MKIAFVTFRIWHDSSQGMGWSGPHKRLFTLDSNFSDETIKEKVIREISHEFDEYEGKLDFAKENFELIISSHIFS